MLLDGIFGGNTSNTGNMEGTGSTSDSSQSTDTGSATTTTQGTDASQTAQSPYDDPQINDGTSDVDDGTYSPAPANDAPSTQSETPDPASDATEPTASETAATNQPAVDEAHDNQDNQRVAANDDSDGTYSPVPSSANGSQGNTAAATDGDTTVEGGNSNATPDATETPAGGSSNTTDQAQSPLPAEDQDMSAAPDDTSVDPVGTSDDEIGQSGETPSPSTPNGETADQVDSEASENGDAAEETSASGSGNAGVSGVSYSQPEDTSSTAASGNTSGQTAVETNVIIKTQPSIPTSEQRSSIDTLLGAVMENVLRTLEINADQSHRFAEESVRAAQFGGVIDMISTKDTLTSASLMTDKTSIGERTNAISKLYRQF